MGAISETMRQYALPPTVRSRAKVALEELERTDRDAATARTRFIALVAEIGLRRAEELLAGLKKPRHASTLATRPLPR